MILLMGNLIKEYMSDVSSLFREIFLRGIFVQDKNVTISMWHAAFIGNATLVTLVSSVF